jgi:hypothetical protein
MRVNKKEIEYSFVDGQEPIKIQLWPNNSELQIMN